MQREHPDEPADVDSDMVDISDLDLSAVADLPHSVFGEALRRALRESEEQPRTYVVYERSME